MEKFNPPAQVLLCRVADALGIPVDSFLTDPLPEEMALTTEQCLRLWSEIKTDEGRQQALEALRAIAEQERA
ncbi:hypothetical protein LOK46_21650 [Methylobacterium sp. NMS14P]|uniref:hypothetical protein n=1 Tax=Methylobacterium sp. NMS14P TaxID=2894310 RepID=UPI002359DD5D|nr:hypothetical protein [Methylobacterium sp. NMS14P]WCS23747.1 hypothetical protein LOK46_21650 [Methylobacterium sp. NMS14P]